MPLLQSQSLGFGDKFDCNRWCKSKANIYAILGHFMVFSVGLHLEKIPLHLWTSKRNLKPLQNSILNFRRKILSSFSRESGAPRKL